MPLEKPETLKSMPCAYSDSTIEQLEKDGWEQDYSFHSNIADQWNTACDKAESIIKDGVWDVILKLDDRENQRQNAVTYIYKRRTPQRIQWEKEKGYTE